MDNMLQSVLGVLLPSILLSSGRVLWGCLLLTIAVAYGTWCFLARVVDDNDLRSRCKSRISLWFNKVQIQQWFKARTCWRPPPTCSSKLEDEIEATVKGISNDFIRPWCDSIGIDGDDVPNEAEKIVTHMLTRIGQEFLPCVDVQKTLPLCIEEITAHLLIPTDCDDESSCQNNQEAICQIARNLIRRFGPDDLVRLAEVELNQSQTSKKDALYLVVQELVIHSVIIPLIDLVSSPDLINKSLMGLFRRNKIPSTSGKSRKSLPEMDHPLSKERQIIKKASSIIFDDLLCPSSMVRSHSLPPEVLNPPEGTNYAISELFPLPHKSATSSRASFDVDTGIEKAIDVSSENKLFSNIRITETRLMGSQSDHYIAFKIVYDGLFEVLETVSSTKRTASCLVHQESYVWKRFSEFLTLHKKLEANPQLRGIIKRLEGPSKMKTVTSILGSKVGRTVTEERIKFLVNYLRQLINLPAVCNSLEMRNFLDYDVSRPEPRASLMSNLLIPMRLDKVITDGIKGAVNVIKNVLPLDSVQDGCFSMFSTNNSRLRIKNRFGGESILTDCLVSFRNSRGFHQLLRAVSDSDGYRIDSLHSSLSSHDFRLLQTVKSCGSPTRVDQKLEHSKKEHVMMSDALVDLCEVLLRTSRQPDDVVDVSLPAFIFKLFLEEQLEILSDHWTKDLFKESTFISLIHGLHNRLWPPETDICLEGGQDAESFASADDVKREMMTWIEHELPPFWLSLVNARKIIDFLITGLQNQERNQVLIYKLIRIIYQSVECPL